MPDELKFYAVRNKDGQWFRRKGYGGYGESWVDDNLQARIFNKPGSARSQITWWFNEYPSFGCPELVVFTASISEVINDEQRIIKLRERHQKKYKAIRVEAAREKLEAAKRALEDAEEAF